MFPNALAQRLAESYLRNPLSQLQQLCTKSSWSLPDITAVLQTLENKRRQLVASEESIETELLHTFLTEAERRTKVEVLQLANQLRTIQADLQATTERRNSLRQLEASEVGDSGPPSKRSRLADEVPEPTESAAVADGSQPRNPSGPIALSGSAAFTSLVSAVQKPAYMKSLAQRKNRVYTEFPDLLQHYFDAHRRTPGRAVNRFSTSLSMFTRYDTANVLTTLRYGDADNFSSIISSIEFDKDEKVFSTAGVQKKIKIFDFETFANTTYVDVHYPVLEITLEHKISSQSWNPFMQSVLAVSDYSGAVGLWDVNTGQNLRIFQEHEKRAWTVDFAQTDPTRLASGSDDSRVLIWSTTAAQSMLNITTPSNVCTVKFNPVNSNEILAGSAGR
ncbi:photoregulatory zinc-finger protein COP1, variant [Capsaspora owczarzaki ATCC 30864]|uniref:Photoregulatory zinc-finger protein COP1, variant n=1 Tax=Capsaspora owczarzaki (strain ATCC 30864) TaxID=595528 RepID=A0A0D2WYV1_CAPO3|nr:photoregulatory zinc-finger protein COP1, variant [Capsaspora owczarzaki ATCC 30864]